MLHLSHFGICLLITFFCFLLLFRFGCLLEYYFIIFANFRQIKLDGNFLISPVRLKIYYFGRFYRDDCTYTCNCLRLPLRRNFFSCIMPVILKHIPHVRPPFFPRFLYVHVSASTSKRWAASLPDANSPHERESV